MISASPSISAGWVGTGLRAMAGGLCGWAVAEVADRPGDPAWGSFVAAGALAVAFATAPSVTRGIGRGVVACLALATTVGLYLGVPETDHVQGVGVVLAVAGFAEVRRRFDADTLVTMAIDAALVWTAVHGAVARPAALIGGLALLGLLLVAPLVGTAHRMVARPPTTTAVLLVGLQLVFAVVVARNGALRSDTGGAVVISAIGLLALIIAGRLVVALRPW